MKTYNAIRYNGSNHTTIVVDKKNNPEITTTFQATALSSEEAETQLKEILAENLSEGDNLLTPESFKLNITDFTKFTKFTTEQLLKLYDKTEKMLGAHEMIEAVLVKRGAISIDDQAEDTPEAEETKPSREYKKCMTEECLQARLAEARLNYRKFCKFLCTKDKEEHFGIIRSARLDKRSGFIQYRIEIIERTSAKDTTYTELTGRIYGKGDDSKDLTIFDTKPEEIQLPEKETKKEEPAQAENNTNIEE